MSIIWITGLSGAGKTTLAQQVIAQLAALGFHAVRHIDGDAVRRELGAPGQGYAREQRLAVAQHIAALARAASRAGDCAIVSTISLFHTIHAFNRAAGMDYFEVLVECAESLRHARRADSRALQGPQVGVEITAEFPADPHLRLDSGGADAATLAAYLILAWQQRHV